MGAKTSHIRNILYGLRTQFGGKIILSNRTVTTDYDSGERSYVDEVVRTIRHAIVLPEVIDANIINLLGSVLQENHGAIQSGSRLVIVDGRQLRGTTVVRGMFATIDSVSMEVSSIPMEILSGQGYLLIFRRKA